MFYRAEFRAIRPLSFISSAPESPPGCSGRLVLDGLTPAGIVETFLPYVSRKSPSFGARSGNSVRGNHRVEWVEVDATGKRGEDHGGPIECH